jgi:ankyrin repeat protein
MASVLYVLVERPISRWRSLVPDRSLTAVSAGFGGAAGSRSFELAMGGHTEQLVAALDSGTPVDLANDHGDTLLILAADHSRADTVAALLARGADHSRTNDRGQTALSVAVYRGSAETVGHLLAAGGDPDAGAPSARATAGHFDLPGMRELLEAAAKAS